VSKLRNIVLALSVTSLILLVGCGQNSNSVPQAVIQQTQSQVQIPTARDIQSLSIASDGAGSVYMSPNNPASTIAQVLDWLKTAKPVSVQFPKLKITQQGSSGGYTGPSRLFLSLKDKENITITPSFYVWSNSSGGYDYHYLNGIIQYQTGNQTVYFNAPQLFKWLKDDQWKTNFKLKTG
jgi:hypothetical protein